MGAAKDIIVAVELGSSAIRAIAGKRQPDGTLQILAVSQEENNCDSSLLTDYLLVPGMIYKKLLLIRLI